VRYGYKKLPRKHYKHFTVIGKKLNLFRDLKQPGINDQVPDPGQSRAQCPESFGRSPLCFLASRRYPPRPSSTEPAWPCSPERLALFTWQTSWHRQGSAFFWPCAFLRRRCMDERVEGNRVPFIHSDLNPHRIRHSRESGNPEKNWIPGQARNDKPDRNYVAMYSFLSFRLLRKS
jgi:hypothetical protein